MNIAAFYARVSTADQKYSLEVQLDHARKYAATRNLTIPDHLVFQDAETSKKPLYDREGGRLLLNTIAYHRSLGADVPHLIITKLDRLDRTTKYFLDSIETITNAGVTLHITDFQGDTLTTGSPIGQFFLTVMSAIAQFERSMITERTTKVLDHLRSKNICTGSIPFGKQGIPIPNATTKSGQQQYNLADHPAEIQAILLMHNLRAAGHSYKQIADHLNDRGIPTKTGASPWQSGNVFGVLNNRTTKEILQQHNQPGGEDHAQAA